MCVLAGLGALSAFAGAFSFDDAHIVIDRALNSPTLTVRYSGATIALVELKVNGESLGTRSVSVLKNKGETNFTLNLSALRDGENTVEVCLYDKAGKLVGTEKTVITTDNGVQGPVFLTAPKVGATVRGPVEINVGFGLLKNSYVSFFIDSQFKSLSNTPPFSFIWDTEKETNGWHEVEAWVIDESSTTFKTRKVRIFVNNPGGRTERISPPVANVPKPNVPDLTPVANGATAATGAAAGLKTMTPGGAAVVSQSVTAVAPILEGAIVANGVKAGSLGNPSASKVTAIAQSVTTGPRYLTPTGTRTVGAPAVPTVNAIKAASSGAATIAITKGQRLPNYGSFAVIYNSSIVKFDVAPRIQDGVPMTPFRHLLEKAGGKVDWEALSKSVHANADGREIYLQIGDKIAQINKLPVELEIAPFLERGRTIVPLSFIRESLNVNIEYDKATGHVLITSAKKQ
jgi:hypothetical protein